ncbi:RCC1 domain-containing protein 1 [Tachyglossus aculeatus]|uniref:RCC1 domain-containing protein 1 n=1 Tax=Tachyglossus aculeatus TaxID=9261 RepID=UPI0018F71D2D|nr:RCC1 domain-containing protein 1 [Tachyglossus aculeatus]
MHSSGGRVTTLSRLPSSGPGDDPYTHSGQARRVGGAGPVIGAPHRPPADGSAQALGGGASSRVAPGRVGGGGRWAGAGAAAMGGPPGGSGAVRWVLGPEPLRLGGGAERERERERERAADAAPDGDRGHIVRVRPSWSYTAFVTGGGRGGRLVLSGSVGGGGLPSGCRDALASERHLLLLRAEGPEAGGGGGGEAEEAEEEEELQAWAAGAGLRGEPLWRRPLPPAPAPAPAPAEESPAASPELPLVRGPGWASPRPPFYRPLAGAPRVRSLALGGQHALLLAHAGALFAWGAGRHGQLGHGTLEPEREPRAVEALQGLPGARVAAGAWHSLCLTETGDVYVWGWNESGQLALPCRALSGKPSSSPPPAQAGEGAAQPGSISHDVQKPDGDGDGAEDRFITIQPFPALLDLPGEQEASNASCGSRHTAVVTRSGELYTWGWGKYGQLGHSNRASLDRAQRVEYFSQHQLRVEAVTCGPWNTYVYAVSRGPPTSPSRPGASEAAAEPR